MKNALGIIFRVLVFISAVIVGTYISLRILVPNENLNEFFNPNKQVEVQDVLVVPNKEKVSAVIEAYYEEHKVVEDKPVVITNPAPKPITLTVDKVIKITVNHIKEHEGFTAKCKKDFKQYSNGYGTKCKKGTTITKKEAEVRLIKHIKKEVYPHIKNEVFYSNNQVIAAVDFIYRNGSGTYNKNIKGIADIESRCAKMTNYVYAGGVKRKGLEDRSFTNFLYCVSMD